MKSLRESILDDIDVSLAKGEDLAYDRDTLPTVKDFQKGVYNTKWHEAIWVCPNIIKMLRPKFNDIIPNDTVGISIILDASYGRIVDMHLYFVNGSTATSKKKAIQGWTDGCVGSNLRTYKKMAISVLHALAYDYDKLLEVMEYAQKYKIGMNDPTDDFHVRARKFPLKNLLNLCNK